MALLLSRSVLLDGDNNNNKDANDIIIMIIALTIITITIITIICAGDSISFFLLCCVHFNWDRPAANRTAAAVV